MDNSIDFATLFPDWTPQLIRLNQNHIFKAFDCGDNDLNDFLFYDSKIHLKHLNHTTFILEAPNEIIAYYSLANDLLRVEYIEPLRKVFDDIYLDGEYEEWLFEQRQFPAVKIGRLAVNTKYQRQGIGSFIIDSLIYSFTHNNKTGCQFITVDATINASEFYEKNEFVFLTDKDEYKESRSMYRCLLK